MKKLSLTSSVSRNKKIACTISAAALMLGVSSAATVGLHFQENYCGSPAYSGYIVTKTAFGIETNQWENLIQMDTGYGSCSITNPPFGYTLDEIIDTTTSTNGLNPLPNGSLTVNWWGPTANYTPFEGYAGTPPNYYGPGGGGEANDDATNPTTGEQQIYATFIRDGINYGPPGLADNDQPKYTVEVTGLKSLFTNSPFVVETMASSDSIETLTNVMVIDVAGSITNLISYPSIPPVANQNGTGTWARGAGGGLSTGSAPLNTDHLLITSVQPQHGGEVDMGTGFNHGGTISGFIITDKPVVSMSPQSIPVAGPGDSINLSAYVIGVPPVSYQWTWNGQDIPGATNTSYSIASVGSGSGGNYALFASNAYGMATSQVSSVTVDQFAQTLATNLVFDSNPINPQNDGVNMGATWAATNSDGTVTRDGVMSFIAADSNGVTVADSPSLDGTTGTVSFWMRSSGTDASSPGTVGAALFCRISGNNGNEFLLLQNDTGNLYFQGPTSSANSFASNKGVSDNKWHFVALTFDQSASGGVAIYVDGSQDNTNANGASWSWTTGQPLEIGYTTDANFREYNGSLDDVRYYSTNLTASQISSIYTTGSLADTNNLHMQLNFDSAPGNGFILKWLERSAVLQSAPSLQGPWSDVPGAVSPYPIVPAASQQFFRYFYVPQALVSNPFLM